MFSTSTAAASNAPGSAGARVFPNETPSRLEAGATPNSQLHQDSSPPPNYGAVSASHRHAAALPFILFSQGHSPQERIWLWGLRLEGTAIVGYFANVGLHYLTRDINDPDKPSLSVRIVWVTSTVLFFLGMYFCARAEAMSRENDDSDTSPESSR